MNPNSVHDSVCLHLSADGRRCRMLRKPGHVSLCPYHARQEQKLLVNDQKRLENDRKLLENDHKRLENDRKLQRDQVLQTSEPQDLARERLANQVASLGASGKVDAHEVARALVGIYNALAEGRISSRSAATLGYLGQLLLQSLKPPPRPKSKPQPFPF